MTNQDLARNRCARGFTVPGMAKNVVTAQGRGVCVLLTLSLDYTSLEHFETHLISFPSIRRK